MIVNKCQFMDSFVFAPRNAAHCISGQNKWLETRGLLGMYAEDWTKCENQLGELPQVHPITRALSGTPPRTRQPASASAPINWGLMDKETRIPEYILDNKHRSVCKNAYEMHNC